MKVPRIHLETRQKIALGVTAACVALVLVARIVYLPVLVRIGEQRVAVNDLQVKVADARLLAEQLPQEVRALEEARRHTRAVERRLSDEQSVARILESLSQLAETHRLELVAVQPRKEDRDSRPLILGPELSLREVPLTLQLTGRYRQLGEFLGALQGAPFVGSVQTLTVTKPDPGGAQLRAELILAVYVAEERTG